MRRPDATAASLARPVRRRGKGRAAVARDDGEDPVTTTRLKSQKRRTTPPQVARLVSADRQSTEPPVSQRRSSPKSPPSGPVPGLRRPEARGGDDLRYHLASLVRMSDNLVAKAVEAYDRLFALDVRDQAEIHLQMGADLAQDGNVRGAIAALRKALQLRPDDAQIRVRLGELYLTRRHAPEAALREFVAAAEQGADDAKLHLMKAEALSSLERHEEAVVALERALELDPQSAEASYRLGVALDAAGEFKSAVQAFRYAIELAPHEVVYHQSLGLTLESAGRRREAIRSFKRALELERRQGRDR